MLKHLNNLLINPASAWKEIESEYYENKWLLIRQNLGVFLIINPFLSAILHIDKIFSWGKYLKNFIFYPVMYTAGGVILIICISLLIGEIYRVSSFRDPQQNIFKLFVFSSLPFFSAMGLTSLPLIGKIISLTGLVYSIYIFKVGLDKYIWIYKSSRRRIFLVSSIIAFAVFSLVSLIILSSIKYIETGLFSRYFN
ncbi:MAG: hypothetical protein OEV66_06395 [Spirochaetia bacterium]|nr:hypothetical protein [Spirochaetia bacterium]